MSGEPSFWQGRRVLVTGHTGFKGAWLALWLAELGAEVHGFALDVPTQPSLFELARAGELVRDGRGDVRDPQAVDAALAAARPEVVFHLAAQPLVRRSFADPRATYATNVMGTVNVLEAVRTTGGVRVVVNVTSDKCYDNREQGRAFREDDPKGGHDPYSSSKGAAELVADAYRRSYFAVDPDGPRLASARAGNVIGGGDWGEDRLVPDLLRGAQAGTPVAVRSPAAVRPWQHVLNPLSGYLLMAERLWDDAALAGGWNFGPDPQDAQPVAHVAERIAASWPGGLRWEPDPGPHPHEARTLRLDSGKAREQLGWAPRLGLDAGIDATVAWHLAVAGGADAREVTLDQVRAFSGAVPA